MLSQLSHPGIPSGLDEGLHAGVRDDVHSRFLDHTTELISGTFSHAFEKYTYFQIWYTVELPLIVKSQEMC